MNAMPPVQPSDFEERLRFEMLLTELSARFVSASPSPDDKYKLVDYSSPANPKVTGLLYNGDAYQGPARFVGNHAYILGSGVQILDLSAATEGPVPEPPLQGSGSVAVINDLLVASSNLYAAENTDLGGFISTYSLAQTPAQKIGSFALNNETPFSLVSTGHFLFAGTSTELLVLDTSNPSAPSKVASLPLPTSSLALVGNVLYAGTTDNRLVVINGDQRSESCRSGCRRFD